MTVGGEGMTAGVQPASQPTPGVGLEAGQQQRSGASKCADPASLRAPTAGSPWETRDEGVLEDGWGLQRTMQTLSISQLFPES